VNLLRDIFVIARHELADSIRSRRVAVFLVLYLAGAMIACSGFISVVHRLEQQLSEALALSQSRAPGAVIDTVWKSRQFQDMITHLVGDPAIAREFFNIPVIALFYGWLAFVFTPLLVMLSASGRISEEVSSGSARFVLVRTRRQAWCLGKFAGQAVEVIVPLMLSAIGAWCVARFRLPTMDGGEALRTMIIYAWKVWLYSLPFVGLALGISQATRSPYLAMTAGFIAWIALVILSAVSTHFVGDGIRQAWQLVQIVNPLDHQLDLWRTDPRHVVSACVFLVALAFTYLSAGYAVLARKDL
jgi:ABC-type transport system involved in multi-copper enzyme maturation permease subunit